MGIDKSFNRKIWLSFFLNIKVMLKKEFYLFLSSILCLLLFFIYIFLYCDGFSAILKTTLDFVLVKKTIYFFYFGIEIFYSYLFVCFVYFFWFLGFLIFQDFIFVLNKVNYLENLANDPLFLLFIIYNLLRH